MGKLEYRMGLFYISGPINTEDLSLIETKLSENGIILKSLDKNGEITASLEEFTNAVSFLVTAPLTVALLTGVLSSATWDSIKYVTLHTFKKINGKMCNKITSNGLEKKELTYGIEIKTNDDHFNFIFNGISSDKIILEALDKILPFIKSKPKETSKFSTPGLPDYIVRYDEESKLWIAKRTDEIIQTKIERDNSKRT